MIKNEDLRTPLRVRLVVGLIGIILLGSTIALYLGIFVQYGPPAFDIKKASVAELETKLSELRDTVYGYTTLYNARFLEEMKGYRSEVKGFNEAAVEGVSTRDLREGDGATINSADDPYLAFYIGWKSDETVFDSSFDDYNDPVSLSAPIPGSRNMIQGWLDGIVGMRIGGVREITMSADFAYGSEAMKFIVMLIPFEDQEIADFKEFGEVNAALRQAQSGGGAGSY